MSENVPSAFPSGSQLEARQSEHFDSTNSVESGLKCPACQYLVRPGELLCPACGRLLVTPANLDATATNVLEPDPAETFNCPRCGQACGAGVLDCPRCGWLFGEEDATRDLDRAALLESHQHGPLGAITVDDDQPITIEVDGKRLTLPIAPSVVLGRYSAPLTPSDPRPHVDLTVYDAAQKGVSRQHAKISRKYGLIYVTDLGSTNGTILNSSLLIPYTDQVIRSGDRVRLGDLSILIIFPVMAALGF